MYTSAVAPDKKDITAQMLTFKILTEPKQWRGNYFLQTRLPFMPSQVARSHFSKVTPTWICWCPRDSGLCLRVGEARAVIITLCYD
jgi:hypothetical protein